MSSPLSHTGREAEAQQANHRGREDFEKRDRFDLVRGNGPIVCVPSVPFGRARPWALARWLGLGAGVGVMLGAMGCSEDETAPVTTITLTSLSESEEISGVVGVHVETTGADEVRYEIAGDLLALRHDPPFDFQWNTRSTPNGIHILQAIAVGQANSARDEVRVIVNNIGAGAQATILVEPIRAALNLGDTLRFSALVLGVTARGVDWRVPSGKAKGTIDQTGLYTAPLEVPRPPKALVVARSAANPDLADTAEISLRTTR